jgi:iron complex transport system substrate-binding protein
MYSSHLIRPSITLLGLTRFGSRLKAVQDKRVYLAPNLSYGWLDAPPGVNRLIGVRWLTSILYPKQFPDNLQETTQQFYKLFYQVDLTDEQVAMLLTIATSKWQQ